MLKNIKNTLPVIITFITIFVCINSTLHFLQTNKIDATLLNISNYFLFFIGIVTLMLQSKTVHHKNPNVFVRSIMGGMMIKMFLTILGVMIYVYASGNSFNKRAIFISLFLYLIYLAAEVFALIKMNNNKHA
jgi:hypothetical protein